MVEERFNGWANRETWALMLHVNNDEGLYEAARGWLGEASGMDQDPQEYVRLQVEGLLNPAEFREEFGADQSPGLARIAFEVGSLWRVDWREVVDALSE